MSSSRGPSRDASSWLVALAVLVASALLGLQACSSEPVRRSVLLITVDTLRADYVHAYGFSLESTPRIDALASEGVLFENAIAAATVTVPAHASIMTSRYAREHSVGTLNGQTKLEGGVTLAEHLHDAGWQTAAFVSNVVLRRRSGLDRGFDVYDDELDAGEVNRRDHFERIAEHSVRRALEWLSARDERPFFLWVHLQDPHGPYTPPVPYLGRLGEVNLRAKQALPVLDVSMGRAGIPDYQHIEGLERPGEYAGRYAEEILYADHWIGELVFAAERASARFGLVIALTADHGESMGEWGWFFQHGHATTPDLAWVPFILKAPGLASARVHELVSHVDVAPTLLELAGAPILSEARGLSLVPYLARGAPLPERVVFCDTEGEVGAYAANGYLRAVGPAASSRPGRTDEPLHFEAMHRTDRGEWRPSPVIETEQQLLTRYVASPAPLSAAGPMAPEHIEQLRALGYLSDSPAEPSASAPPVADELPVSDAKLHEAAQP